MKYQDALTKSMELLSRDKDVIFVGYNVKHGARATGTLNNVDLSQCLETPVAENLMAGLSIGLGFKKFKPVLYIERHDFILNALDALVNHLDKMEYLGEKSEFKSPMIIRAVVGGSKPFYPGRQHTQDFTLAFRNLFSLPICDLKTPKQVLEAYTEASKFEHSVLLVEHKDLYNTKDNS